MDENQEKLMISFRLEYEDMKKAVLWNYFSSVRIKAIIIVSSLGFLTCFGMLLYLLISSSTDLFGHDT